MPLSRCQYCPSPHVLLYSLPLQRPRSIPHLQLKHTEQRPSRGKSALATSPTCTQLSRFNSDVTFTFKPLSFLPSAGNQTFFYLPDQSILGLVCLVSETTDFLRARALSQPPAPAERKMNVALINVCGTDEECWRGHTQGHLDLFRPQGTPLLRLRFCEVCRGTSLPLVVDMRGWPGSFLCCGPPTPSGVMQSTPL